MARLFLLRKLTGAKFSFESMFQQERNLKINGIFLSPRGITLPKIIDQTQIQTQPAYTSDTSLYRISFQNVNL